MFKKTNRESSSAQRLLEEKIYALVADEVANGLVRARDWNKI